MSARIMASKLLKPTFGVCRSIWFRGVKLENQSVTSALTRRSCAESDECMGLTDALCCAGSACLANTERHRRASANWWEQPPSGFAHEHGQVFSTSHGLCALQPCPAPQASVADTREANPATWGDGQTGALCDSTNSKYGYYSLCISNSRSPMERPSGTCGS
jgi:hypothetical protein